MLLNTKKTIIVAAATLFLLASQVQAITPSPQMIEQFKSLPKSEQQRLAKQYGVDPAMLGGASQAQKVENPSVVTPRRAVNNVVDQSEDDSLNQATKSEAKIELVEEKKEQQLKRFGYDLFAGEPTTFAPVSDVPVPAEYMVGPGDTLKVQLYGKESKEFDLTINRQGLVLFPELGPISLNALSFSEARALLKRKIADSMIGIESSISMGELRSIRIFVAGDAYKPGSYTVSSLSTITQALFVSGGINEIGSLRNIQLKRVGKTVATLDLYDLLLRGDASGDQRLQSGDVVFIPSAGGLISVKGEVRRPAIYEIKSDTTLNDVITMASGFNPGAYPQLSTIERYGNKAIRTVMNVDLTTKSSLNTVMNNGDELSVKSASSRVNNAITVAGAVIRPGLYQWSENLKVTDLIPSVWGDLTLNADLDYGLLVREINHRGDIEVHHIAIGEAISSPESSFNMQLLPKDKLIVFDYGERAELLAPILKKLRSQAKLGQSESIVSIKGNVRFPGRYPLTKSLNTNALLLAAGGLNEKVEFGILVRERNVRGDISVEQIELSSVLENPSDRQYLLQAKDELMFFDFSERVSLLEPVIKKLKQQGRQGNDVDVVSITGSVRYPGEYPLMEGTNVKSAVAFAGGLTEGAYTLGVELTRRDVSASDGVVIAHSQLDLRAMMTDEKSIQLKSRDILTVRMLPEWQETRWIKIEGEVRFPGTYTIQRGETIAEVLARAGGLTDEAAPRNAIFLRKSIQRKEQIELEKLSDELRRDIAARALTKDGAVIAYNDAQLMLDELNNVKTLGRLVIDVNAIELGIKEADLVLEADDALYIPQKNQTVSVMGQVQYPSTHRFKTGRTMEDYLTLAGGSRKRADDSRTYVLKADGSVFMPQDIYWFDEQSSSVSPGDTIIVPLDTEYKDSLTLWSQVTQIIYNTAVAVGTISNL